MACCYILGFNFGGDIFNFAWKLLEISNKGNKNENGRIISKKVINKYEYEFKANGI